MGAGCSFPDFDKILDFTSAGSESSVSVAVNGDVDKEYQVIVRNPSGSANVYTRLNNDSGSNYGHQYLLNDTGTVVASRPAANTILTNTQASNLSNEVIIAPTGFIKTSFHRRFLYVSGTSLEGLYLYGNSYNSTSNITSINFVSSSGNFTAGTRIIVYRRRVN
jgi:hypothetical protein